MPSLLYEEIQTRLQRYLSGQTSLDEFEDWFVPATWHLGKGEDPAADKLTGMILLHLAEFSNEHWTEQEVRNLLSEIVEKSTILSDSSVLIS